MARGYSGIKAGGERCLAPPLRDSNFCFWHDPDHEVEAQDARRLGGVRRKREGTVQAAYDFEGLNTVEQLQRLLQIAVVDLLALENSVARSGKIITAVSAGAKLVEVGDLAERIASIEAAMGPRLRQGSR